MRVRRERRRRWPLSEKLRILREAFAPGVIARQVAERYEISTGLLFTWRRQALASAAPGFVPVQIATDSGTGVAAPPPPAPGPAGMIEIDMPNGVRMRVGNGVDLKVLRGILAALDGR